MLFSREFFFSLLLLISIVLTSYNFHVGRKIADRYSSHNLSSIYKILSDKPSDEKRVKESIVLGFGQPILIQFINNGFSSDEIKSIFNEIYINFDLRKIKSGQRFDIEYNLENRFIEAKDQHDSFPPAYHKIEKKHIKNLFFKDDSGTKIAVKYNDVKKAYECIKITPKYNLNVEVKKVKITNNLFSDSALLNIKPNTIYQILNEYAFSVDFQRDIRKNDELILVVESKTDEDNYIISQKVLYSNLILSKKGHEIFLFENNFFNRKGESIIKTLLLTPVDGARISSGFSLNRRHPILGYTRAHKGIDFAAPIGTPIQASGDGAIVYAGWKGGYGKLVSIRHNSEYTTNYGHLSKIKSNVRIGTRVRQKDIIGYVGMTGIATGPHLHYEVKRNGKHINPKSVKTQAKKKMGREKMEKFQETISNVDHYLHEANH